MNDLRFALRQLGKSPGFSAAVVVTLALGIGVNTALFSVISALLLRPLPYTGAQRLVELCDLNAAGESLPITYANFLDWQKENRVFERMAAYVVFHFPLGWERETERVAVGLVSADFFAALGVRPALGRDFAAAEDGPGAEPVAILSHELWQRRFAGDPACLGRSLKLDNRRLTVVGILPPGFRFYGGGELFVPYAQYAETFGMNQRNNHNGTMALAQLKPQTSLAQARGDLSALAARLEQTYPEANAGLRVKVTPLRERLSGGSQASLWLLLAAAGLVLVIAALNVANLLLARGLNRDREMALRAALGAGRGRLTRQLLTESVVLAAVGGGLGLLLGVWSCQLLSHLLPWEIRENLGQQPVLDWRVLGFALGISLLTGLLCGLAPAWGASRLRLVESLKADSRTATAERGRSRLRCALVVSEIATAVMTLVVALLMLHSLYQLRRVDPGFAPQQVLTVRVDLPWSKSENIAETSRFYTELLARIQALPGIQAAGATTMLPLTWQSSSMPVYREGAPVPAPGEFLHPDYHVVTPGYFRAMGIPLLQGRFFGAEDPPLRATSDNLAENIEVFRKSSLSAIVSKAMAERLWPNDNPLGKRFRLGTPDMDFPWATVVGVVGSTRQHGLETAPAPEMHLNYLQFPPNNGMTLALRTTAEVAAVAEAVRREVFALDKDVTVHDVRTMEQRMSDWLAERQFSLRLILLFAGLALALAAVGIYGVMSYTVGRRTLEMGVRLALGAQPGQVLRLVLGHGLRLIALGVALGLAGAFGLTRIMRHLLFGISATDPLAFGGSVLLLGGVALLACYVPAHRAAKLDPMVALRHE